MTMKPTMVQLSPAEKELLTEAAAEEGISRSELVRRALSAYLANRTEVTLSKRIREGYERIPEPDDEVAVAAAGARRMLSDPDIQW